MNQAAENPQSPNGKKICLAVSGGIACYKVCTVASRLVQAGHDVRVIMTEAATHFVGKQTFESLTGHMVASSLWNAEESNSQHVDLARWCDLMILAPATANTIAKIAHGFADNLVTTTLLARPLETPVFYAPAMNAQMWENPITQQNIQILNDTLKFNMIGPEDGWQACRTMGSGRMSEAEKILEVVFDKL